ncbi:MAG: hypothetical protein LBF72_01675 [Holosporales bacterium]|jgi:glycerol-3-phosphate dehydrogenase (NAD(P)+)|nr:hypothetical protein [Holosporales bacterium]
MSRPLVLVLGAGAFGSALAISAVRAGKSSVFLLPKFQSELDTLQQTLQSPWISGIQLPQELGLGPCYEAQTTECAELFKNAHIILWAIPAGFSIAAAKELADVISKESIVVVCSKGLINCAEEQGEAAGNGEVVTIVDALSRFIAIPKNKFCVLSGPNFAREIALGAFSAAVVATLCQTLEPARFVADVLESDCWKFSVSGDYIGAQFAGALKNVLAIAAGIAAGQGKDGFPNFGGQNTRAAIISLGLGEIATTAHAYCCNQDVNNELLCDEPANCRGLGIHWVGDTVLTCCSEQSRNMAFGMELGKGGRVEEILRRQKGVVEGFKTAKHAFLLARKLNVKAPILEAVYKILYEGSGPEALASALFAHFEKR